MVNTNILYFHFNDFANVLENSGMTLKKLKHYHQVAEYLREEIVSGKHEPAKKLPTERALSDRLGVSRVTVRRALRSLEEERLISRKQGSGTYVSPSSNRRIPLMIDYTGSMARHAPGLARSVISWKIAKADDITADKMQIEHGAQLLYSVRIDKLNGEAIAYDHAYISMPFASDLTDKELSRIDFIEVWTKTAGFTLKYCSQEIEAVSAGDECLEYLSINKNMPILRSTEIYFSTREIPAGLFISYYNPEYICISSRYYWRNNN